MPSRYRRHLLLLGLVCCAAFVVGAAGAARRYNRIVYGALPLALALACFGVARDRHRATLLAELQPVTMSNGLMERITCGRNSRSFDPG